MDVSDSLVIVQKEEWSNLKERLKQNWPFGLTAYNALLTVSINVTANPNYPVKVYSVFGDPDNGIVFIWNLVSITIEISLFCMKDDTSRITEALVKTKRIDWTMHRVNFYNILKEHVECCVNALFQLGRTEINVEEFYILSVENEIALKYDIQLPGGFSLQVISPEKADIIDNEWPHKHPGSLLYFEKMLSLGEGLGLVNDKGDLIAWGLTNNRGNLNAITTKPEYRRKGYAQIIVKALSKRLIEQGRNAYGGVMMNNEASKNMFTGLGFTYPGIFTLISSVPKFLNE